MDIKVIKDFDVRGTNPNNTVVKEEILIEDKACPWVIPNGSPFFGDYPVSGVAIVRVYNAAGTELVRDTDYWVEEEFIPLVAVTGRPIMCFIRLSDAVLAANTKVFVSYQSTGAYFIVRNGIKELLEKVRTPSRTVDWNQIIELPATFPAGLHYHHIKTELSDWFELTAFFVHITKSIQQRPYAPWQQISGPIKTFFDQLYVLRDAQNTRINDHGNNYNNPHVFTKVMAEMDKHPNYATGTIADHLTGTASDLLATPEGVMAIVNENPVNTEDSMDTGVIPISKFGGDSFIPPNISGSFEGVGSLSVASAICLEKSGLLMLLTPHNDGRSEGLYFSYVTGYDTLNAVINYTGFKYDSPSLTAKGFNPTEVISGSNHKIMLVANFNTDEWYATLTNGTLNPAAHQFVKMDMQPVWDKVGAAYKTNRGRLSVTTAGNYALLIVSTGNGLTETNWIFRCPLANLLNAETATWEHLKVSFTDYNGVVYTDSNYWLPWTPTPAAGGGYSAVGPYSFVQPATSLSKGGRTSVVSAEHPTNSTLSYLGFFFVNNASVNIGGSVATSICEHIVAYQFNPETGVMVETSRPVPNNIDFVAWTQAQRDTQAQKYYHHIYNGTVQNTTGSVVMLANGIVVMATSGSGLSFPRFLSTFKYSDRSKASEVLTKNMDRVTTPLELFKTTQAVINAPLPSGVSPARQSYEPDGELYMAADPITNTRKVFFRAVTGKLQARPEVTNTTVTSGLKSRPLTNTIYVANLTFEDVPIGMSGSNAELAAGGVECGSTSFSSMGYSSMGSRHYYPRASTFKAPAANNMLLSCPRTYSKVIESAARKVTYKADSFFGCRQELIDKFRAMIPPEFTNPLPWSATIHLMHNDSGGMFKGLNIGLAIVSFTDPAKAYMRQMFVLFRPVIEAPNADHPDVHWLKDITELDRSAAYRSAVSVRVAEQNLIISGSLLQSSLQVYRDGNKLSAFSVLPYSTNAVATIYTRSTGYVEIDLTTNKLSNVHSAQAGWSGGDMAIPIPGVGMSDFVLGGSTTENSSIGYSSPRVFDYTGGAARIYKKTLDNGTEDWYIGPTVYPQTGWSLFFQDGVNMMINGETYSVPSDSVDLRDIDPAPYNKTFYVYAAVEDRKGKYIISDTKLRHSARRLHVATVTTSATQILTIERFQPFLIGDLELSTYRKGGSIPVSSGQPQADGDFVFLKQSELLP